MLLALVVRITLREPERGRVDQTIDPGAVPPLPEVARHLWGKPAFRHLILGGGITSFGYVGIMQWTPSFFDRSHGLGSAEIGTWLALSLGIAGGLGTLAGGKLVERFSASDVRWMMWWPAAAGALAVPFVALVFLWPAAGPALVLMAAPVFLFSIHLGPMGAAIQGFAGIRMRGIAVATSLFFTNLIGLGLGPQVIGMVSDALAPATGADSLRYALLAVALPASAWAAVHFALGARTLARDIPR